MRVIAYDPKPSPDAIRAGIEFVPLERLLSESHFVSIHAALTPQTRGLIGDAQLRLMKPTAYLINTARGALVDEQALAVALKEGVLAGAALDTFQEEPLAPDHVLHGAPNLLLTPHQASFTRETGAAVSEAAAQAVLDAANGVRPRWIVDEAVLESPSLRTLLTLG
jgi:phosphoglycerate dehydrogenase-like enzyme